MKANRVYFTNTWLLSFFLIAMIILSACSEDKRLTGGSTTTENGIVVGKVLNVDNDPFNEIELQFIPTDYNVNEDHDSVIVKDTTDKNGLFEVQLPPEEDYHLLIQGKKEGIFLQNFITDNDSLVIQTDTLSTIAIQTENPNDWVIIGTPYQGIVEDGQVVFEDVAEGTYPLIVYQVTVEVEDLEVNPNDSVLIDDNTVINIPIIRQSLMPDQITKYSHNNHIHSVTYASNEFWIGTQSTGIYYAVELDQFLTNSLAQNVLNREALIQFESWEEGVNRNFILKTENYCYYFINSAFLEVGQATLPTRKGQACLDVLMSSQGEIYISFETGIEHADQNGLWQTTIDMDNITHMKDIDGVIYGWNDAGEIFNLDDQSNLGFDFNTQPIMDFNYYDQTWVMSQADSIHLIKDEKPYIKDSQTISLPIPNNAFISIQSDNEIWGIVANGDIWKFDGKQVNYYEVEEGTFTQGISDFVWVNGDLYLANKTLGLYKIEF